MEDRKNTIKKKVPIELSEKRRKPSVRYLLYVAKRQALEIKRRRGHQKV